MIFDNGVLEGDILTIRLPKNRVERMRDHYWEMSRENDNDEFRRSFYLGKADVYIDILKCYYLDDIDD